MISGTIKKYENKENIRFMSKPLQEKTMGIRESFTIINLRENYKVRFIGSQKTSLIFFFKTLFPSDFLRGISHECLILLQISIQRAPSFSFPSSNTLLAS